jgi:hypothetical protein
MFKPGRSEEREETRKDRLETILRAFVSSWFEPIFAVPI